MTQATIATVVMADPTRKEGYSCVVLIDGRVWPPLLSYFRQFGFSLGQQRPIAYSVFRFLQWIACKGDLHLEIANRNGVFSDFADDLLYGTLREGEDSSGLSWESNSANNCRLILRRLLKFCDWLEAEYGTWNMNPWSENPSALDQLLFWRHWDQSKDNSILGHLKTRDEAPKDQMGRKFPSPAQETVSLKDPKAFPEELIEPLFMQGFIRPGFENHPDIYERLNLRDVLITMLCLFGGLRMSEPLHLWLPDVYEHPYNRGLARVYVYHPSHGIYHDQETNKRWYRGDFLDQICGGKKALNLELGRRRAGWKGMMFTDSRDKFAQVYWIDEKYGHIFLKIWDEYLRRVRCDPARPDWTTMPWSFLNENNIPMGSLMYVDSFQRALRRIGVVPQKNMGFSPHGLRHRYGRWMAALGLDEKTQQIMLHHRSAASGRVYSAYTPQFVENAVKGKSLSDAIPQNFLDFLD